MACAKKNSKSLRLVAEKEREEKSSKRFPFLPVVKHLLSNLNLYFDLFFSISLFFSLRKKIDKKYLWIQVRLKDFTSITLLDNLI